MGLYEETNGEQFAQVLGASLMTLLQSTNPRAACTVDFRFSIRWVLILYIAMLQNVPWYLPYARAAQRYAFDHEWLVVSAKFNKAPVDHSSVPSPSGLFSA
jgi:hypothetical protein